MLLRAVECVKCGAPIEPGGNFCDQCGTATHSDACGTEWSNSDHTDATRLLAAAAVAKGHVRTWILTWLSERNRAVPPEVGIDLEFVARVARFGDHRQRRFDYAFFALALLAAVAWLLTWPVVLMLVVAASAGLALLKSLAERDWLTSSFQRDQFSKKTVEQRFTAPLTQEQRDALGQSSSNLTVYSGFSPFIGAGLEMAGWSFAIATDKSKTDLGARPLTSFRVQDLYAAIAARLDRLQLPRLEQRDHYFVHGPDVCEYPSLLPNKYGRPLTALTPELVERCSYGRDPHVRHYRWIRVSDWAGDITVSCFLRCYLRGPTLFVEFKRYLLTPLQASIRHIDDLAPARFGQIMRDALMSIVMGPLKMAAATLEMIRYFNEWVDHLFGFSRRQRRKMIDRTARWNYGAAMSVRQAYASGEYVRYFQRADSDSYEKTLEKEILDSLVDYLDAHGIDTSDIRDRQATILNQGVIVQNGNINAETMAVGQRAQSVQRKIKKVVQKAARVEGAA
jgi:hypothetical protein